MNPKTMSHPQFLKKLINSLPKINNFPNCQMEFQINKI